MWLGVSSPFSPWSLSHAVVTSGGPALRRDRGLRASARAGCCRCFRREMCCTGVETCICAKLGLMESTRTLRAILGLEREFVTDLVMMVDPVRRRCRGGGHPRQRMGGDSWLLFGHTCGWGYLETEMASTSSLLMALCALPGARVELAPEGRMLSNCLLATTSPATPPSCSEL